MISIIVPVYNSQEKLKKCIESICANQDVDYEAIFVDDGSTDESADILDEYAARNDNLKVIHQENGGVSKARNTGLEHAMGDFVTFIDSDDYVEANYLKTLYEQMTDDVDLTIASTQNEYPSRSQSIAYQDCKISFGNVTKEAQKDFLELNKRYYLYGPWNKLFRRTIIEEHKIRFPLTTSYGEDLMFNMQYLSYAKGICYKNKPLYHYVIDDQETLSTKYRKDRFDNGIMINKAMVQCYKKLGMYTEEMEAYIAHRIFDDAYNSLFELFSNKNEMDKKQRQKAIRYIMDHDEVAVAAAKADTTSYPKKFVDMIVKKKYKGFYLYMTLRK
ncbi:glycosyltransferase [Eubacterium oxidoreducens]|uniref:Glycosyl transferase family 2 n=1 Tax=Eubacterium oxidoreducens TaxID=1732 RepID=A0A1G6AEI5_EUBOX|nr:glycosyltransferase [Eubacterium oxidoreducens]SDB06730.1 Glycosyl transferase family 2 [Eubacterium oxidoreducens]